MNRMIHTFFILVVLGHYASAWYDVPAAQWGMGGVLIGPPLLLMMSLHVIIGITKNKKLNAWIHYIIAIIFSCLYWIALFTIVA